MRDPQNLSTPLAYALAYARIGWQVFPLEPGTKRPLGQLVPRGMLDATIDTATIQQWWQRSQDAGIGIALAQSGLVAIDVDPRNGGTDTFDHLQADHGSLRSDVMAFTGGGGEHHVFVVPQGAQLRLPGTLGHGVDLKANGYIVVEPSIHPNGNAYGWEASSSPLDGVVPSPLPDWLRSFRVELRQPGPRVGEVPVDAEQARDVREALYLLDADDREDWLHAGMALHSTRWGHPAYAMWCAWSQQSPKFDPTDCRRVWNSYSTDGERGGLGLTLAWVFSEAQKRGWQNHRAGAARLVAAEPAEQLAGLLPINLAELSGRDAEPMQFLVDKWLPVKAVTVLTAHGGVGKSTVSLQLAVCMALGLPWFGIPTICSRVLIVSCEDSQQAVHWRLQHVCRHLGVKFGDLDGQLVIFDMTEQDCVLWARGQATARMTWLATMATQYKAGCVIVDNASDTFGDNENDRTAVRGFVRALARIAFQILGSVLVLAHVDKASARGTIESTDTYSGSTAWNNSARSRWAMVRNKDQSIEITNEKNNYAARQDPFKVNYDPLQHVFAPADAGLDNVSSELLRNKCRLEVMQAMRNANARNENLSITRNSPNNAHASLRKSYGLSKDITADEFWQAIDKLQEWGYVEASDYTGSNRQTRQRYMLTEAGHRQVAAGSGAAPLWRT